MSLDTTIKALGGSLTDLGVAKGVKNIDSWLETLADADFRGAQTIHANLEKLKTHLEAETPDGAAIGQLLKTLGEETGRAASHHADNAEGKKITQLAELLGSAGGSLSK